MQQTKLLKEGELFFRQWLRSPKSMGSVIPSSRFLAHGKRPLRMGEEVTRFQPGIVRIMDTLPSLLAPAQAEALAHEIEECTAAGVPTDLSRTVAALSHVLSACDIVAVAESGEAATADAEARLMQVARAHFSLAELLDLAWLGGAAAGIGWR